MSTEFFFWVTFSCSLCILQLDCGLTNLWGFLVLRISFPLSYEKIECGLAAFTMWHQIHDLLSIQIFPTTYLLFTAGFEHVLISMANLNISSKGKTTWVFVSVASNSLFSGKLIGISCALISCLGLYQYNHMAFRISFQLKKLI